MVSVFGKREDRGSFEVWKYRVGGLLYLSETSIGDIESVVCLFERAQKPGM
jgi:hypothetical protein